VERRADRDRRNAVPLAGLGELIHGRDAEKDSLRLCREITRQGRGWAGSLAPCALHSSSRSRGRA
jgi:hypothetical protein